MKMAKQDIWDAWARRLTRMGLSGFTAWALDATSPLHILGAQLVYISQPVARLLISNEHLTSLAEMLEQPQQARSFTTYLREAQFSE